MDEKETTTSTPSSPSNDMPLVSIVTPCLNSQFTIKEALDSILGQAYKHIEYIVIDGDSMDGTRETLRYYEKKFKDAGIDYQWVSKKDDGIYHAMNKGIERAKGDLIGILNSDDWYESNAVAEMVSAYKRRESDLVVFHGHLQRPRPNGSNRVQKAKDNISPSILFKGMPVNHPSAFVCAQVYKNIGSFDTSYRLSADYEFVVRAHFKSVTFTLVDKVITTMGPAGASVQLKNRKTRHTEDFRIRRQYFTDRLPAAGAIFLFKMLKYRVALLLNLSKRGRSGTES